MMTDETKTCCFPVYEITRNSTLFVPQICNLLIYSIGEFRGGEVRNEKKR